MVSKAWIRHKKKVIHLFEEHWITKLPSPPGPMYGICTEKGCEGWTPIVAANCVYNMCQECYCGICGRYSGGFGPMGCPCDGATRGHNTLAERPAARGKVVRTEADITELFDTFTLVPFKKRKSRRRGKR